MAFVKREITVHKMQIKYQVIMKTEKGKEKKKTQKMPNSSKYIFSILQTLDETICLNQRSLPNSGLESKGICFSKYPGIEEVLLLWFQNA